MLKKKKKKKENQPFLREKNRKLEMGGGFRTRALHPVKNNLSTHPGMPPAMVAKSDSW